MDKYEYNIKADQIKKLYNKKDFAAAAQIADQIDWRRVKDNTMLSRVADIYENNKEYEKAKSILLIAYERSPMGRQLAYRLTVLSLRTKDFVEADEFYSDFVEMAPMDVAQYILKYRIAKAKGEHSDVLIQILEAYVEVEKDDRWQYELAKLYHESGYIEKCVSMCDDIILWFNDGKYADKALALKELHKSEVSKKESKKNTKRYDTGELFRTMDLVGEKQPGSDNSGMQELSKELSMTAKQQALMRQVEAALSEAEGQMQEVAMSGTEGKLQEVTVEGIEGQGAEVTLSRIDKRVKNQSSKVEEAEKTNETVEREPDTMNAALEAIRAAELAAQAATRAAEQAKRLALEAQQKAKAAELAAREEYKNGFDMDFLSDENSLIYRSLSGVEEDAVSEEESKDVIEIFEFDAKKDGKCRNIGEELTKTAEIDIDEINLQLEPLVEQALDGDRIQNTLRENVEHLLGNELSNATAIRDPFDAIIAHEEQLAKMEAEAGEQTLFEKTKVIDRVAINQALEESSTVFEPETIEQLTDPLEMELEAVQTEVTERLGEKPAVPVQETRSELVQEVAVQEENSEQSQEVAVQEESPALVPEVVVQEESSELAQEVAAQEESQEPITEVITGEVISENETDSEWIQAMPMVEVQAVQEVANIEAEPELPFVQEMDGTGVQSVSDVPVPEMKTESIPETLTVEPVSVSTKQNAISQVQVSELEPTDLALLHHNRLPEPYCNMFGDFTSFEGMEELIAKTLDNLIFGFVADGTSSRNNVIISGKNKIGKTTLGLSIIKAANRGRDRKGRRVAKVKASVLNKRGVATAMAQIIGTDLIIEQAGSLAPNTAVDLMNTMRTYTEEMLIILEDDKNGIDRLVDSIPKINQYFGNRLDIPEFEIRDLVKVASAYALRENYEIDGMGMLALHAKLDEITGKNQGMTFEEVEEVIDDAIEHSQRITIGKLFGKLKKNKSNLGVLTEEDFL